ncbi:hypothetical protein C8F01DRAFT_1151389 [Mycena amicta]|nr:hypothetical protein C8F01DRAFT_1151389 [Mycena amicta]
MSTTTTTTVTSTTTHRIPPPSAFANHLNATSMNGTTTPTTATRTARVRFDAECILIPDTLLAAKRPKLSTKSYSLPLWRKGRDREEEESHVVLKVNLPSFKSKKSSSHSRERDQRNPSRSPPPVTPHIPSCLRVSSNGHPLPAIPAQEHVPLTSLIAVHASTSTSTAAASPSHSNPAGAAVPPMTVPIRACCPECVVHADAPTEEFSRGAMRIRRRGLGFGVGSFSAPDNILFSPLSPSSVTVAHETEDGDRLISGSGVANVNRLVAELEERKRSSRSATPSPVGTPPISPMGAHHPGRLSPSLLGPALARIRESRTPSAESLVHLASTEVPVRPDMEGRGSPLLPLGIAVDEVDKELRRRSIDIGAAIRHGHGAGFIVLGEEDDEDWPGNAAMRKPSPPTSSKQRSPATTPRLANKRLPPLQPPRGYVDDEEADLFPLPSASSSKPPTPIPSPRHSPAGSKLSSPAGSDVSVNLHRLAASASEGAGGKASPLLKDALANNNVKYGHRRTASGGSESVAGLGLGAAPTVAEGGRERSRSEAVCVALGGVGMRERQRREQGKELAQTPMQGHANDREGSEVSVSSLPSIGSFANTSQLHIHRMAKCERGLLLPPGDERDFSPTIDSRGRGDLASLSSNTSRSSSRDSRCSDSDSITGTDEKPLPGLPRLATSILAAGPYSPALAPRLPAYASLAIPSESFESDLTRDVVEEEVQQPQPVEGVRAGAEMGLEARDEGNNKDRRASLHLRIPSAPETTSSVASTSATVAPSPESPASAAIAESPVIMSRPSLPPAMNSMKSTIKPKSQPQPSPTTRTGRGKSASTSATLTTSSGKPPQQLRLDTANRHRLPVPSSHSTQPPSPTLQRASSLARIRSTSMSSVGKATGRKAFGALVDVLRGVASVGGGPSMAV